MSESSLKQKTIKGLFWKFFDQSTGQLMQFVVGVIMARLLSPEDFGIAALPAVFISIATIFMDSGFGIALVRKPDLNEKDLSTSFYYGLGIGVVMYAILFFAAPLIAQFYGKEILTQLVRITALNFLWIPLNTPQTVILQRKIDFKTTARISIINKIVAGIVGVSVAYAGYGVWALVFSSLVASFLGVMQTWIAVRWIPTERFCKDSFKYLWTYGNKIIGVRLIDTIYSNITPIIVGKAYNTYTLGLYDRANSFAKLPANQLGNLLMSVTFPVLCKIQDKKDVLKANYRKMVKVSAFIDFPIFLLLCALSRPFVLVVLTEKWAECIVFLQILCLGLLWWPIHSINTNFLQVIGRSDLFFRLEIIKKIAMAIVLFISIPFGIVFFCWGIVFQNLIALYANTYYTGKLIGYGFVDQLLDIKNSLLASIVMYVVVSLLLLFIDNVYYQLGAGVIVGVAVYFIIAYILKFEEFGEIQSVIESR